MNLIDKATDFADAVKHTREFIEVKQAQSLLNRNPVLMKKVEEIKKKQQELLAGNSSKEQFESRMMYLSEELRKISNVPEVKNYLTASNNFNNMISHIFKTINDSLVRDLK